MFKIKRNWMYEFKIAVSVVFITSLIFGVLPFIFKDNSSIPAQFIIRVFEQLSGFSIAWIMMVPLFAFIATSPIDSKKKANVYTDHLPLSKKQLLWVEFKQWLIYCPIMILIMIILAAAVKSNFVYLYTFKEAVIEQIFMYLVVIIALTAIESQIISAIIVTFAKNLKWYIAPIVLIPLNVITFSTIMISISKVVDINNMNPQTLAIVLSVLLGFLIVSLIMLVISFRYIEDMHK